MPCSRACPWHHYVLGHIARFPTSMPHWEIKNNKKINLQQPHYAMFWGMLPCSQKHHHILGAHCHKMGCAPQHDKKNYQCHVGK